MLKKKLVNFCIDAYNSAKLFSSAFQTLHDNGIKIDLSKIPFFSCWMSNFDIKDTLVDKTFSNSNVYLVQNGNGNRWQ